MWKIQDNDGCIYSGTEEEMNKIWMHITESGDWIKEILGEDFNQSDYEAQVEEYDVDWNGYLQLVEVHKTYR